MGESVEQIEAEEAKCARVEGLIAKRRAGIMERLRLAKIRAEGFLPCPFCGSKDVEYVRDESESCVSTVVACHNADCGAMTKRYSWPWYALGHRKDAKKAWNTRT